MRAYHQRLGRLLVVGLALVSLSAGCGGPPSASPFGGGGRAPRATITPTIWPPPQPSPEPGMTPLPTPTPRPDAIDLGMVAMVEPWEVQVLSVTPVTFTNRSGQTLTLALLDLLAWNRSDRPLAWPFGAAAQTVLLVDAAGATLDARPLPLDAQHPLVQTLAEQRCTAGRQSSAALARGWEPGTTPQLRIPPGMGFRTWLSWTVPADTDLTSWSALVRLPPTKTTPSQHMRIRLRPASDAPPPRDARLDPVTWGVVSPPAFIGAYRVEAMQVEPLPPADMHHAPCGAPVAVLVELINYAPTVQPAPTTVWLVDQRGRYYRPLAVPRLPLDPGVRLRVRWTFPPPLDAPAAIVVSVGDSSAAVALPHRDASPAPAAHAPTPGPVDLTDDGWSPTPDAHASEPASGNTAGE